MTTVYEALAAVMGDVQAVRKSDRNAQQGFNFRGVDAVVNAVGPVLRKHKVLALPRVDSYDYSTVEVGTGDKRRPMGHARVMVTYTFYGPDGDSVPAQAPGEAFDAGDKATPKAMAVAWRTALIQALSLPTDEPDPDEHSYERAAVAHPKPPTVEDLLAAAQKATSNEELSNIARTAVAALAAGDVAQVREVVTARRAELAEANQQAMPAGSAS